MKYFFLIYLVFLNCSFGSRGNKLSEDKIILTNLITARNSIRTIANLKFVFFDDQGDSNLNSFQITSQGQNYLINLNNDSELNFDRIDLLNQSISQNSNENAKHNEVSSTSGSGNSSSGSLKIFQIANNFRTKDFMKSNSSDERGDLSFSQNFSLGNFPQGRIGSVIFHFNEILFSGSSIGSTTKNFIIRISKSDINSNLICSNSVSFSSNYNLVLQFKYVNLFRDNSSFRIFKSIHDLSETNVNISENSNRNIYNEIVKNLNLADTLKEYGCIK